MHRLSAHEVLTLAYQVAFPAAPDRTHLLNVQDSAGTRGAVLEICPYSLRMVDRTDPDAPYEWQLTDPDGLQSAAQSGTEGQAHRVARDWVVETVARGKKPSAAQLKAMRARR
ncbi:hypothetical protein [Promicromonospora sp. NPDC090134]|uniref:hypothetical protein n=1 Tax=Promicromonospora sp. NPDC090134 TaxID=3364408 RepID=UPI0038031ADB